MQFLFAYINTKMIFLPEVFKMLSLFPQPQKNLKRCPFLNILRILKNIGVCHKCVLYLQTKNI